MNIALEKGLASQDEVRDARTRITFDPAENLNNRVMVQIDKTNVYAVFLAITVGLPVWHYVGSFEYVAPE